MTVEFKSRSVSQHCDNFIQGLADLKKYAIPQALDNFQRAYDAAPYGDIYHNKYASFCGVARVLNGDRAGIELCRDAVRQELIDGDVYLNLAYAEWHIKSRKRSVGVLKQGLMVDRRHPGLKKFQQHLGQRSRKMIFFVSRDHVLNKVLGKLVRKKESTKANWTFQNLL